MISKKDIRTLSRSEICLHFKEAGEKKFRGNQVYEWLWKKSATSFDHMTNLSLKNRLWLQENYDILPLKIHQKQVSHDGTVKFAFMLFDNRLIEGVLIPAKNRMTACVSSQVGCSLACKFCATGFIKRERNLSPGEIYDQVVAINDEAMARYNQPLSNIVFMGMGEPLLNYKNVISGIDKICSPEGLGMSYKRITLSTAGIAKMIETLGQEMPKIHLALSLHAANDEKRNKIMSINETNNLQTLTASIQKYQNLTKQEITLEYMLLGDFNDTEKDADELVKFSRKFHSKVNLIEYNPIDQADFKKPTDHSIDIFAGILAKNNVNVNVRRSRGRDIDAACGQLANK